MTPSRTIILAALAILLPTLIFASVIVAFNASNSQSAVKAAALERAHRISSAIDADVSRSASALGVLATSQSIKTRDWPAARARAAEIARLNDDWQSVTLLDLGTGETVFSTAPASMPPLKPGDFVGALQSGRVTFGGIARRAGRCICALMAEQLAGQASNLALIVELEPAGIQQLMLDDTPPGAVSAVVDREGRFLARSVDYAQRVGTPATIYVRNSLKQGEEGFYEGKTFEGLVNLTAFAKSPVTGWSTHMAVSSKLVGDPQKRFYLAVGIATVLALLFAAAIIWIMLRTLTARRESERQLREAQHLEALGRLSGGVAHDFNNMLAIISGNLEIAQRAPDLPEKVRRNLDAALQGVDRAADLTRGMLAYARKQDLAPTATDPCVVLRDTGLLLERTIGDHIRLRCEAGAGAWLLLADRSELQNAIINLAVNARDAMPGGGEIVIDAFNAPAGETVGDRPVTFDSVVFHVHDTGEGIPADVIDRVSDPFFTTKQPGHGTGLGLSQVVGFAKQSNGEFRIRSTVNVGTDAYLILPRHPDRLERLHLEPAANAAPRLDQLRILLVEDDSQVRATLEAALLELGQSPVSLTSADDAVAALDADASWDLVITDNQMPGLSGVELVQRMRERGLTCAAMIISALPVENAPPGTHTIQKPFLIEELHMAILAVMAGVKSD